MSSNNNMHTRAKISVGNSIFEFEGTEEFVTARLQEYGGKILASISGQLVQRSSEADSLSDDISGNKKAQKSAAKKPRTATSKAKSTKVTAERFDIHGEGNTPSLEAFLDEKKPGRSNAEKIVVIGYYIAETLGKETFTEGQVEYAYKMLKYSRPNHLHQIMINAKNDKDWFEQTEDLGSWQLTRSGDIFVTDELPRETNSA